MPCGADTEANELITSLTAGKEFNVPAVDLTDPQFQIPEDSSTGIYAPIARLTNDDLTTGTTDGSGTFDALMRGFKAHLAQEYEKGRITGADYAKVYLELTQGAMANATQYLLGRDQAYWAAVQAQMQARMVEVQVVTARLQLETAKTQLKLLHFSALEAESNYALSKMKLATESITYCVAKYQLENMMPEQLALLKEQLETARSQTLDTRTDGSPVTGSAGKQKDLYNQQITSYKRDAEIKAAKSFIDAWITQKTIDEGILPPEGFENDNLDLILKDVMFKNFGLTMIEDADAEIPTP